MTSIITGDIIKSRKSNSKTLLPTLKEALTKLGKPKLWNIVRGDSFQIEMENPEKSFEAVLYIKACLKSVKNLDARMAIGVGKKDYTGKNVAESNGEAFRFSGETLETLKKDKVNLKIKTTDETLNKELNLYFKLALISMDSWTENSAEIVRLVLDNPDLQQKELGEIIGISQHAVSYRIKRANLYEILELNELYKQKINQLS